MEGPACVIGIADPGVMGTKKPLRGNHPPRGAGWLSHFDGKQALISCGFRVGGGVCGASSHFELPFLCRLRCRLLPRSCLATVWTLEFPLEQSLRISDLSITTRRIGNKHVEWMEKDDNMHIPRGERLAILVTGLSKCGVLENMLRSLVVNVIEEIGLDLVDVYVHLEVARDSNQTTAELSQIVAELLPVSVLRASIVDSGGQKSTQLLSGLAAGG